jgi:hypothetical protein
MGKWEISERTDFTNRRLAFRRGGKNPTTWWPNPSDLIDWQIVGEPYPKLDEQESALSPTPYKEALSNATIVEENLRKSHKGLCLAGRVMGESATREMLTTIKLRCSDGDYGLDDLMTIYGWSKLSQISRMTFFNTRSKTLDRSSSPPSLVTCDGNQSFLVALSRSEFQTSDVIGVMHRMIDRDQLDAIGERLADLRQWYTTDIELASSLPSMPLGMASVYLTRKDM